jgi:hypothetical protein
VIRDALLSGRHDSIGAIKMAESPLRHFWISSLEMSDLTPDITAVEVVRRGVLQSGNWPESRATV